MRDVSNFPTIPVATCDAELALMSMESILETCKKTPELAGPPGCFEDMEDAIARMKMALKLISKAHSYGMGSSAVHLNEEPMLLCSGCGALPCKCRRSRRR